MSDEPPIPEMLQWAPSDDTESMLERINHARRTKPWEKWRNLEVTSDRIILENKCRFKQSGDPWRGSVSIEFLLSIDSLSLAGLVTRLDNAFWVFHMLDKNGPSSTAVASYDCL